MRNDEYIIVCTFGVRRMNGFEVIEEGPQAPTPSRATVVGSKKKKKKALPKGPSAFEIHRCLKRLVKLAGQVCGCCLVSRCFAVRLTTMDTELIEYIYDQSKTKLCLAILAGVTHDANFDNITWKLKQRRQRERRQRERQTSNKFRLAKQQLCTCQFICLCTFLCSGCTTSTWNCVYIFTFWGWHRCKTTICVFFSWTSIKPFRIPLQLNSPTCVKFNAME